MYNVSLGERSCDWNVGFWEQKHLLTLRRQDSRYYKQVHSQVPQDVLLRLDKSYQAFFKKIAKYPRFKRKAKLQLAKAWRQVRRCRDDFVHKASKALADEYTRIVFENLDINKMVKNHNLASAIMDATWRKLHLYTAYKVERCGGRCLVVNPNGTSRKCSRCGVVAKEKLDLSVRTFECHSCGQVMDRDLNAAIYILNLGLERTRAEKQPILARQRISKFASRKQEAHGFIRG